jgi:hypothetical protein
MKPLRADFMEISYQARHKISPPYLALAPVGTRPFLADFCIVCSLELSSTFYFTIEGNSFLLCVGICTRISLLEFSCSGQATKLFPYNLRRSRSRLLSLLDHSNLCSGLQICLRTSGVPGFSVFARLYIYTANWCQSERLIILSLAPVGPTIRRH